MLLALRVFEYAATATAALTEADDTLGATASVTVRATLSVTEANDTLSAAAAVLVRGTAALTEANDSLSASATISVTVSAAITEADDVLSATALSGAEATRKSDGHWLWDRTPHTRVLAAAVELPDTAQIHVRALPPSIGALAASESFRDSAAFLLGLSLFCINVIEERDVAFIAGHVYDDEGDDILIISTVGDNSYFAMKENNGRL